MSERAEVASGAAGCSASSMRRAGLIGLFVRQPTAANLLMILMVATGLIGASRLQVQFFPSIHVPIIVVGVEWPGAYAADAETQILNALEPKLRFLDGVSSTVGMAREGAATVTLEFDAEQDMQKALADVERADSDVTTLPADAEVPKVQRITYYEPVVKVAITGPFTGNTSNTMRCASETTCSTPASSRSN